MKPSRYGTPLVQVVLACAGLALGACSALLNIEDRSLDPSLGDASVQSDDGGGSPGLDASGDRTAAPDVVADSSPTADGGPAADAGADVARDVAVRDEAAPDVAVVMEAGRDATADVTVPGDAGPDVSVMLDAGTCPDPCVLATGLNHPFFMASDNANVYWTELGDDVGSANGSVKYCPINGCPPTGPIVVALAQTNPRGIALDAQNVYWVTATYSAINGGVWSCPLGVSHCSPTLIANADIPFGMTSDATHLYWVDYDDSTVHRVLKTGTDGGSDLLYDGGGAAFILNQVVVDGTFVYFTDANSDVFQLPLAGGNLTLIGSGPNGGDWPVAQDTNFVYYGIEGSIQRTPKGAVDSGVPIASNVTLADNLVIDPATGTVYWTDWGTGVGDDGTVGKVSPDGGGKVILGASLAYPEAIAVSGPNALWLSYGMADSTGTTILPSTGALYRQAK